MDKSLLEMGIAFHGHRCPAMPLGFRAGLMAMERLGVERAQDKELQVISETGKGHAAGCFLDGIMAATGCTYGKSNIEKRYYNKLAFTLIDTVAQKAIRVSIKPAFFARMLTSPFVEQRKAGIPPQDISPEVADPLIDRVLSLEEEQFLDMEPVTEYPFSRKGGVFEASPCAICGELTFVDKLTNTDAGLVCLSCKKPDEPEE
ncbi:MAG: formylmethanofuran dehydrogenase [Nitrospiraceae bacterium]|nr:formylmethanofuran dehydrogenase [Nitrospiraceae bacterium]